MPLREYECDACGHRFEVIQKFSDPPLEVCPKCGAQALRKLAAAPAFHLKGSGWYVTDYAKKESGSDSKPEGGSKESTTSDKEAGKTETSDKTEKKSEKTEKSSSPSDTGSSASSSSGPSTSSSTPKKD